MAGLSALVLATVARGASSVTVNRVIQVQATGTPVQNCASLRNILSGLAGSTSGADAYLVKLEPGDYECGTNAVIIPSWVAVEGSGSRTTQIFGRPNSPTTGIVHFDHATNAELRFLRVHHWSDTQDAVAISVDSSTITIEHIFAFVFGSGQTRIGLRVSGGPDFADQSIALINDSAIISSDVAVLSKVTGSGDARVDVFGSELSGVANTALGGTVRCAGSYAFGTFGLLSPTCVPPP